MKKEGAAGIFAAPFLLQGPFKSGSNLFQPFSDRKVLRAYFFTLSARNTAACFSKLF